jgi:2-oxoisovalerate dehydrogenase E2 component (dihydrolipoyl transacylase)
VLRIIDPALSSSSPSSSYASAPAPPSSPTSPRTMDAPNAMREAGTPGGGGAVVPIRGYHRLMVKTMTSSLHVPHMVYSNKVNVDALTAVRDLLRPLYAARDTGGDRPGGKLTYMPFFVKAMSLALTAFPVLNSTINVDEMTLTYHDEHRIGIAVTRRGDWRCRWWGGVRTEACWR